MVACLAPAARGQTPTIEQRWVKTVDGGQPAPFQQDWAVDQQVVGDFIYVFGGVRAAGGGSSLSLRRFNMNDTVSPPAAPNLVATWPGSAGADEGFRSPEAMTVVPGFSDADFLVVTGTTPGAAGDEDIIVLCYHSVDLSLAWTARYAGPDRAFAGSDVPVAIFGDTPSQTVTVVGTSESPTTGKDVVVLVYRASDGMFLYEDRYSSPGNAPDIANDAAMVVNSGVTTGEVFTLATVTSGASTKLAFLKHHVGAAPVRNWAAVYQGETGVSYVGVANAARKRGDGTTLHYATGYKKVNGALEDTDWVTLRLYGDDPVPAPPPPPSTETFPPVWTVSYAGAAAGADKPCEIAATSYKDPFPPIRDGVVVTGFERGTASEGNRYTTILYEDGNSSATPAWRNRTDGALLGGNDSGLRLDTSWVLSEVGEVFVSGRLENSPGTSDMFTMKFDTTGVPFGTNKVPEWFINFPSAGQPNAGSDVPESITFLLGISDPNIQPPPPGYAGPGYDRNLPTLLLVGSGVDSGTGENWKVIRYVEWRP